MHNARLAALRGEDEPRFGDAVVALRDVGEPFWVATALLEQAEWLAGHERADETAPLLTEARETFERLRAAPRLARVDRLETELATIAG